MPAHDRAPAGSVGSSRAAVRLCGRMLFGRLTEEKVAWHIANVNGQDYPFRYWSCADDPVMRPGMDHAISTALGCRLLAGNDNRPACEESWSPPTANVQQRAEAPKVQIGDCVFAISQRPGGDPGRCGWLSRGERGRERVLCWCRSSAINAGSRGFD
jgi:hypothetical protein